MIFIAITNLARNTVFISLLLVLLFYQKDEPNDNLANNQVNHLKQNETASFERRIHLGFSKYGKIRLQQSMYDTRQL